ncbi:MAG TPA: hypothetical protein VGX16_07400 [Solirubrobacteraceae bacterium]|jgi:hypothetical protein|nr:hypothetical protein [Solirubrobacteraceae bacterium]
MSAREGTDPGVQPSEAELRAAYEEELRRLTSADVILQASVSLLNLGGRRLGLGPGVEGERDLEQVRDAIDGARALVEVLERRVPGSELRPLRDALSELQLAYAREVQSTGTPTPAPGAAETSATRTPEGEGAEGGASRTPPEKPTPEKPGPAQASGRLWVPGS